MSSDRLTFKSYKKEMAENNLKPSRPFPVRQPPKPVLVRLSKLAFQFSVVANLAYIFVRAKQKDETKGLPSKLRTSCPPSTGSTVNPSP